MLIPCSRLLELAAAFVVRHPEGVLLAVSAQIDVVGRMTGALVVRARCELPGNGAFCSWKAGIEIGAVLDGKGGGTEEQTDGAETECRSRPHRRRMPLPCVSRAMYIERRRYRHTGSMASLMKSANELGGPGRRRPRQALRYPSCS